MSSQIPTYNEELQRVNTTIAKIKGKIKEQPEDFIVEERIRRKQLEINKEYKCREGEKQEEYKENKGERKWLVCVLKKKDIDTFRALLIISKHLSISPNRISMAGIKDKKAHTIQLISLYSVSEERVRKALPRLHSTHPAITLFPIYYGERVFLGELEGNRFTIKIRDKEGNLNEVIEKYKESYDMLFPNYFGEQRFGGKEMHSIEVAKHILRGEIKEGINALLLKEEYKKRSLEDMQSEEIMELKKNKLRGTYERRVLDYLLHHNLKDYAAAWSKVMPDSLKKLIVNTYQSYVFNEVASRIIKEYKEKYGEEEGVKKCREESIMLPSAESLRKINKERYEHIIDEILERDGISYQSFSNPLIAHLGIKGVRRKIIEQAREVEVIKEGENEGTIRFFLNKGSYATEFLKEIINLS